MDEIKKIFTNAEFFIDNKLQSVDIGVDEKGYIASITAPGESAKNMVAEVVDLQDAFVYPGFEDAHNHPARRSRTLHEIDLRNKKVTWDDVKALIIEELKEKDMQEWVVCHGWQPDAWGQITQKDLDELSTNRGIFLIHSSYHAGLINSFGLTLLKDKGIKLKHEAGAVHEDDFEIAENATAPGTAIYFQTIKEYLHKFAALGITAVHDMYVANINQLEAYTYLAKNNELPMPVIAYLDSRLLDKGDKLKPFLGEHNNFFVAGIKLFIDGTFGTRTAAMYDMYKDDTQNGVIRANIEVYIKRIQEAAELGLTQVAMHCIGVRGIDTALEIHKAVSAKYPSIEIWRLEHCEMPSQDAISYMVEHGIVASMQPNFLWDSCNYENRLGADIEKLNQFSYLLEKGVSIIFGSDDMPSGPLEGIEWVTKKAPFESQKLSVEKAIFLYSKSAPSFLGVSDRGEISLGKSANFVVLDKPISSESNSVLPSIKETWIQGVLRYKRPVLYIP